MKQTLLKLSFLLVGFSGVSQIEPEVDADSEKLELEAPKTIDYNNIVYETWAGTRVLNNHSTEMLPWRNLEFIVAHKFGDIAGTSGGLTNFYGFDDLADVRIAFEYGIRDNINIGIGRNKGVGLLTSAVDGYFKYRILRQEKVGMPISLTVVGAVLLPYGPKSTDSTSAAYWPNFEHRLSYTSQILVSRKIGDRISLQLNGGYNHRNFVAFNDVNGLFFVGGAARVRATKWLGFITEYNHVLNRPRLMPHQNALSFGVELLTGGHNFTLVFSNAKGINESIFLNQTTSNWLNGQFRFGFSINRRFKL